MKTPAERLRLAVRTVTGRRDHNEDAVLSSELSDGRLLLAVADGMGGHAAGEVASAMTLEVLEEALEGGKTLEEAFDLANDRVYDAASSDAGKKGMGTTLVAMLVEDGEYRVANVGDSRGFLLTEDGIRRITDDHSYVAEAVRRGQEEAEAMDSPWKDALTRSIGTSPTVEVDVFGPFSLEDDVGVLLCSDGLYKTLSDEEIRDLYGVAGDVETAARTLESAAYEAGSDDNISVVIAEFVSEGEGEESERRPAATIPLDWSAAEAAVAEKEGAPTGSAPDRGSHHEIEELSQPRSRSGSLILVVVGALFLIAAVMAGLLLI